MAYEMDSRSGGSALFPSKDTAADRHTLNLHAASAVKCSEMFATRSLEIRAGDHPSDHNLGGGLALDCQHYLSKQRLVLRGGGDELFLFGYTERGKVFAGLKDKR